MKEDKLFNKLYKAEEELRLQQNVALDIKHQILRSRDWNIRRDVVDGVWVYIYEKGAAKHLSVDDAMSDHEAGDNARA